MAKRNTRKTDPETAGTPETRQPSTVEANGRPAAPKTARSRRKSDTPAATEAVAAAPAEVSPVTAEAAVEPSVRTPGTSEQTTQSPAPAFTTVGEVAAVELSHDRIAERAYHLYLERGRQPGDPFADWLEAERELRERFVGA
jgi:hypothetical protein